MFFSYFLSLPRNLSQGFSKILDYLYRYTARAAPQPPMSIETLTVAILSKMSGIGKWPNNFFIELVQTWLSLKGRFNFDNLARQGKLSAESYYLNSMTT
jgi:hypothetical protein